jgi:hypothetical protein
MNRARAGNVPDEAISRHARQGSAGTGGRDAASVADAASAAYRVITASTVSSSIRCRSATGL